MSKKKPTRSEIESALAGKTVTKKRVTKPLKVPTDHASSRRRQKVLGGNISGVSAKPKNSPNLLTWVIGILSIMVIAAMLVPEPNDKSDKHQASMDAIKKVDKIYTEARIPDTEEKTSVTDGEAFSRNTDIERAKQYRIEEEQEKKITALLDQATALIEKQRFTKPENDNAYAVYKEILKLDGSNYKAKQGIEKIQDYYIGKIQAGIKSSNFKPAEQALLSLQAMQIDDDQVTELKEAIENKKKANQQAVEQAKIDKIIKLAATAYKKGNKLSPPKKNALYYYRQILDADNKNKKAQNGIKKIADDYLELANNAIIDEEYEAAKGYLTTVLAINPEHPSISLMEKQIAEKEKQAQIAAANEAKKAEELAKQTAAEVKPISEANIGEEINSNNNATAAQQDQANIDTINLRSGLEAYYLGDYDKSLSLLQPLADKGISRAQFRIGYMYQLGRGVETDVNKADNIIRSALPAIQKFASEGRAWAQSDLASLYDDGLVLPKDALKAISWYEKAAYQGYAGAQTNLGLMYYYGKGVRTNRELAIEWFKRAAKQGDVTAKKNLEALGIKIE